LHHIDKHGGLHEVTRLKALRMALAADEQFRAFFHAFVDVRLRGIFAPLRDTLLTHGDHYMQLADLRSYLEADERLREAYDDSDVWGRKAILNIAGSGKFSSDRSITEYATQIWEVKPCPIK